MMTRNFVENGLNIMYPKVDHAGEHSGIIGSEFPLFNFVQFLTSLLFDYGHWHGRLINLIISSIGIWYFFKISRAIFNENIAFTSAIVLSVSIWFMYSRKIMPDTFSVSLVLISLFYLYLFSKEKGKIRHLIVFFVFSTLGLLCKIPALSLLSVIGIIPFIKSIPKSKKYHIITTSTISVLIVFSWYFIWVPILVEEHKFQLFFPKSLIEGWQEIIPYKLQLLEKFYFSALHSYIAFFFFLIGIFIFLKNQSKIKIFGLCLIVFSFLLFIIKTGSVFPLHSYYIIPLVPVMSILVAFGLSLTPRNWKILLLIIIASEAILNQQHDFFIKKDRVYTLSLEESVNNYIPKSDLIIINGGQSSTDIYFANRKGWTVRNNQLSNYNFIDSLSILGAKYLIIDKTTNKENFDQYDTVYSDEFYSFYKLD